MRKYLVIWLMIFPLSMFAEHLFEFGLHGGLAGWSAQHVYVSPQVGFQGGAQVYYTWLSPWVIGLRTGVNIDSHNASFGRSNYEDTYSTIDVEDRLMEVSYTIGRLRERYSFWSAGIPLQLALAYKGVLFFGGAKAVFPFSGKWLETAENTALSVYYPDQDNRVYESYPLAASRNFKLVNSDRMNLPAVQWWLALELSYAVPIRVGAHHKSYLMVGAYFDYCFTRHSAARSAAESLIMLTDTRDGFPLQRILTPVMTGNRQGQRLIDGCSPFDVGIKISYAIAPYDPHRSASRACHCLPNE